MDAGLHQVRMGSLAMELGSSCTGGWTRFNKNLHVAVFQLKLKCIVETLDVSQRVD